VYIPSGRDNRRLRLTEEIEYREDGSVLSQFRPQLRFVPKPLRFLRTAFATLNTVLSEPVDVVQVNGPNIPSFPAAFIKIMTGVPCVVFIEAFWELLLPFQSYMKTWQRKWLLLWYRLVYRLFDAYVGGPSLQPEMYIRRGMAPHRIWPFLNNVEVGKLVEDAENALFPVEMATIPKPRIVTVGRLIGEKLTTDAIEVMAALDSMGITAQTVLIGDGPLREELRTLAANLGVADRVHLLGFRPLAEAMAAVKECDLYFAPYQGNALVEAMALGCPIVAYDNEPHREFLTPNKTGVMVPHRDVEAAAVALAELLENPERARALGSEAKAEVFRRYTEDNIVNTWIAPFIAVYARSCGR
jgi:glycosyltransferase involved in cell wall biosynthesis